MNDLNLKNLEKLIESVFGRSWSEQERSACSEYITLVNESLPWEECLVELHNHFEKDINKFDIDEETGYFTSVYKNRVREFCYQLFITREKEDQDKQWINDWLIKGEKWNGESDSLTTQQVESLKEQLFKRVIPNCEFYIYGVYENNWRILKETRKQIYLKALEYHKKQGFKFSENETAVKQLLQYFEPKDFPDLNDSESKKNLELISEVIVQHMLNFGDKDDYGYAYSGFDIIDNYLILNNVPEYLVKMILQKYPPSEIANLSRKSQLRKQIKKIINVKFPEEKDKLLLQYIRAPEIMRIVISKFFFGHPNKFLFQDYEIFYKSDILECNIDYEDLSLEDDNLQGNTFNWKLFLPRDSKNVYLYFYRNQQSLILTIKLFSEDHEDFLCIKTERVKHSSNESLTIKADDIYDPKGNSKVDELFNDIRLVEGNVSSFTLVSQDVDEQQDNGLIINFLCIKHYKCLNDFHIWLTDKKLLFKDKENKTANNNRQGYKESVYGDKIESLTCVVGKNGSGKTTLIQFMTQELHPAILKTTEQKKSTNRTINRNDANEMDNFFAILTIGGEQYSIGNANELARDKSGIETQKIKKLSRDMIDESVKRWGVYDFSNSLTPFSNKAYLNNNTKEINRMKDDGEMTALKNWSEDSLREQSRILSTSGGKNYDTDEAIHAYQMFCHKVIKEMICDIYEAQFSNTFDLQDKLKIKKFKKEIVNGIQIFEDLDNDLEAYEEQFQFVKNLDYDKLCHETSSGQFTKLVFFSKVYLAICKTKSIEELFHSEYNYDYSNLKSKKKNSRNSSPVLIFVDESEIYQHPEWQRKFMYLLLEMINLFAPENKYQIIISTNSPFFLSDMFEEDIHFMNIQENALHEKRTFGQNIHTLLIQDFFMDHTIGEISFQQISGLFRLFNIIDWRIPIDSEWDDNIGINEIIARIIELKEYFLTVENKSALLEPYESLQPILEVIRASSRKKTIFKGLKNDLEIEINKSYIKNGINSKNDNSLYLLLATELKQYITDNRLVIFEFYFRQLFTHVHFEEVGDIYFFLKDFITSLGEKVYRNTLLTALERCFKLLKPEKNRREFLEEQIKAMEKELKVLGGDLDD